MSLEGNTALVTGATSGIGREAAKLLAADGAFVIVSGRDIDRGAETVREITDAEGKARFIQADLASLSDVRKLAKGPARSTSSSTTPRFSRSPRPPTWTRPPTTPRSTPT
jgi:NAD(P)-dependent dehydrogenase (short-subunit alcohol dehydrogenase family)